MQELFKQGLLPFRADTLNRLIQILPDTQAENLPSQSFQQLQSWTITY